MPTTTTTSDEVDEIIAQVNAQGDMDDVDDEPKASTPRRRKRTTTKAAAKNGSDENEEPKGPEKTLEQLDQVEFELEPKLPTPAEKVKTLGSMYAKYGVGDDPRFTIQVWRSWPKMVNGKKIDGFMDPWDQPLSEEAIQAEYGGGQYRVTVMGPHPSKPNTKKHYDSHSISLSGEPNVDRLPRALQGKEAPKANSDNSDMPRMQAPVMNENPKLAEQAMKMFQSQAQADREERRRLEEKVEKSRSESTSLVSPVLEAERRRADEIIRVERERREDFEMRMKESREEDRRRMEEERRRAEMSRGSQRSLGEELAALASSGLLGREDTASKEMFKQILEKHRSEMDATTLRHTQFIESLRTGHASEIAAIRGAHTRELEAEREASRAREARIDERLQSEREERRRDQVRFKEQVDERDRGWRDRMDQAKEMVEASWTSRHQTAISSYEQRIGWLNQEIDRLKSDLTDAKMKQEEKGDVTTQLMKMHEMQEMLKSFAPTPSAPSTPSTGGIGLTGGGEDWKQALAEGLSERAPQIFQAFLGGGAGAPGAPPQPSLHEGQILMADPATGQPFPEPMVIVRDPQSGSLAMSPKSALDAHNKALQAGRAGLLHQPAPRPRVMPDPEEVRRRSRPAAVPNFAAGMPKPTPPWEGAGDGPPGLPEPPATPRGEPRMSTRSKKVLITPEPLELSAQERQGIKIIAKLVHQSVMAADEPEEFVAKVMNQHDPNILRAIVGGYTTDQLVRGVEQVEPNSAGATPAGQEFVRSAFAQLRSVLSK